MHHGNVEQAKEEEPAATEIKGEQTIPFLQRQGLGVELVAHHLRDIVQTAVFGFVEVNELY